VSVLLPRVIALVLSGRVREPRLVLMAWLAALTATASIATGCTAASVATRPPRAPQWPAHANWQRYVVAPANRDVRPTRIVSFSGSVIGAKALTGPAQGDAVTLKMTKGGSRPTVVVDYGEDIAGVPYFVVRSESESPVLSSSYSEGLQYMGPDGDNGPSQSDAGDTSRSDNLKVTASGRLTTGLIQGGERYERITLTSPGAVTLSSVGIRFTAVRATASDYRGWFDSSSAQLNRIWYDGAYTTQLDELPAATLPSAWHVASGSLDADGGIVGILRKGSNWTDYAASFDTEVVDNEAGWVVRAPSSSSGYLAIIDDATDTAGTRDILRVIAFGPTEFAVIADVALPLRITAGSWHHVTTVASGTQITVSLDGRQVAKVDTSVLPTGTPTYGAGTVGFVEYPGNKAKFRDLNVVAPGGAILFAEPLSRPTALADFTGPTIVSPDPLPVIMDGGKRDRVIWSGDLGVEGPNVFYTTGTDSFVRGSLQLLASYQSANGESGANVPPTSPLGTFPESGYNYSASYSMDEVDNIVTYFLYTGDLAFMRLEWPMITRELAYNKSMVDSRGLLATNSSDGLDWDYYDGPKIGEVTAYNDIYYETLVNAATMAGALGLSRLATTYRQEATTLRSSINRYLFDPSTGLYEVSNLQPSTAAQDGNSLAVLFGVAPRGRDRSILTALKKILPSTPYGPLSFSTNTGYRAAVSPFITNEEVQALLAAGDTGTALSLMGTLWGYMDAPGPDYTGADWELVEANGSPGFGGYTSLAHGWASGATADLSASILGVQPSSAGYRTWLVQPHPGSLSWAEGNVPTPQGAMIVRWAQDRSSGQLSLQVSAPASTSGTISVPVPPSGATVTFRATRNVKKGEWNRSFKVATGANYLPVTVLGGATYYVAVIPRGGSNR
jgi:alpha-L-rhamnosidase